MVKFSVGVDEFDPRRKFAILTPEWLSDAVRRHGSDGCLSTIHRRLRMRRAETILGVRWKMRLVAVEQTALELSEYAAVV